MQRAQNMNESKKQHERTDVDQLLNELITIDPLSGQDKGRRLMHLMGGLTKDDVVWVRRVLEASRAGSVASRAYFEAAGNGASYEEGLSAAQSAWLDATADWDEAQWEFYERTIGDTSEGEE